jgi:hypothetical protein
MADAQDPAKTHERLTTISLIAANLIPLVGILYLRWDGSSILFLYWGEAVIVGCYNILRMLVSSGEGRKLIFVPLFCCHFSLACAAYGFFLVLRIHQGPIVLGTDLLAGLQQLVYETIPQGITWPLLALAVSHGVSFRDRAVLHGEGRDRPLGELMFWPYGRLMVLHAAIVFGVTPVMMLGSPASMLTDLVIVKICLDLYLQKKAPNYARFFH